MIWQLKLWRWIAKKMGWKKFEKLCNDNLNYFRNQEDDNNG